MTKPHQLIAEVISLADGEIIGRVRLQKILYLLEQLGLKSGISFSYHHYGPYSRELDEAIDAAKAFHGIREVVRHRASDGAPFSVFNVGKAGDGRLAGGFGALPEDEAKCLIGRMKATTSTVIELAATIHWLATHERVADWRHELDRRKGAKTGGGRTEAALELLQKLDLDIEDCPAQH